MLKETEKRKGKSVSNFMSLLVKKSYQKKNSNNCLSNCFSCKLYYVFRSYHNVFQDIMSQCHSTAVPYLFQKDKRAYDPKYDVGSKVVQCGRKVILSLYQSEV